MSASTKFFCGFAKIPLAQLKLNGVTIEQHRDICSETERKNYQRLVSIFKREGCKKEEQDNAIVVVLGEDLTSDLPTTFPASWDGIPLVSISATCIHGLHRLLAADEYLVGEKRNWLARVYRKG